MKRLLFVLCVLCLATTGAMAQKERVKNQPYADLKWFHLGFHVGLHAQDLLLTHSGVTTNGETWFAEIPSYSPGFSVGVIGDLYLNPYFNLRLVPTIHFGDKKFIFREQSTGEEFTTNTRSTYLSFPLDVKYTALRLNNYRPYLIGGVYGSFDLGRKKDNPILLKGADFGLEFGIGCDIYLPFFKLCPELKFCFGLVDLLEKDRSSLNDRDLIKYTDALSKATSRMVVLTFNFE
ncbi:type IX secretion/gliding motility protein PorT/SprT [Parabacteroides chinchillae]|uniref:Probable protein-translocating porin PorT n=1 Tax=Parabacteroides chinchillae TaxID=871327 RepID=A0A8G2BXL1_9BACT|nr:porin family protein [Parabacteroides chinchillae]SEG05229.1 probable protein-translocating porin PorT [Parabacteroides chinchillae]